MTMLRDTAEAIIGLFIDDGSLALWAVLLIALVTIGVFWLSLPALWGGGLLLIGCIAILAASVLRAARP
ncbi:MAG TPA: hypothetical protein VL147_17130 [Devosia sp.]|nr:hypothetical protein [Devosia sp.]